MQPILSEISGGLVVSVLILAVIGAIAAFVWAKIMAVRALISKAKQAAKVARDLATPEGRERLAAQATELKQKGSDFMNQIRKD